jgi:hypothetical protein
MPECGLQTQSNYGYMDTTATPNESNLELCRMLRRCLERHAEGFFEKRKKSTTSAVGRNEK